MNTLHKRRNSLYYEFVGKLVRLHRRDAGKSITRLAAETELQPDYLDRLEHGEAVTSHKAMSLIAECLGIPVTRIYPTIQDWGK